MQQIAQPACNVLMKCIHLTTVVDDALSACKSLHSIHQCPRVSAIYVCKVGACIVSQDQIILSIGYNGFPRGCPDMKLPWAKLSHSNNPLETKSVQCTHLSLLICLFRFFIVGSCEQAITRT